MSVYSLSARADFDQIFRRPDVKIKSTDFLILAKKTFGFNYRIGFITPKKKLKRAVDRNRFRRVIREFIRQNPPPMAADLIVIAHQNPKNLHRSDINCKIEKVFTHLYNKLGRK